MSKSIGNQYGRIVVKCGTSLVTSHGAGVNERFVSGLSDQVSSVISTGSEVVLVVSGAVGMGRSLLREEVPESTVSKQVLAAVGQAPLMAHLSREFNRHDIIVAQTLIDRASVENRTGYLNARNTLLELTQRGILPVVNENDVVATEELNLGDNDRLSGLVANLVDADLLVLLTDVDGYFRRIKDGDMQLVPQIDRVTDEMLSESGGTVSGLGTGGMRAKLEAARLAMSHGVTVVVASGTEPDILHRIVSMEMVGSWFVPTAERKESRDRWMLANLGIKGRITVDIGAEKAVRKNGKSLLPAGVIEVQGNFDRGGLVVLCDVSANHFGRGLVNYGSTDIGRIKGCDSGEIISVLGYSHGQEIIHRNNMVISDLPVTP